MADSGLVTLGAGLAAAAKVLQSLKDVLGGKDARAEISQLYDIILAAQADALQASIKERAMLGRIGDLEKELAQAQAWDEQKSRYKLVNPWPGNAVLVYALKESCKASEAPHWICTKCYDDGRRTILQPTKDAKGWVLLRCATCRSEIHTEWRGISAAKYAPEDGQD